MDSRNQPMQWELWLLKSRLKWPNWCSWNDKVFYNLFQIFVNWGLILTILTLWKQLLGALYLHLFPFIFQLLAVETSVTWFFLSWERKNSQCYRQWVYRAPLCITLKIKIWVVAYLKFIIFFPSIKKKFNFILCNFLARTLQCFFKKL